MLLRLNNSTMKDFKIINENENSLFNRKEIKVGVETQVAPTHEAVLDLISEKFSTKPENIKIKKISEKFGSHECIITAHIYDSKKAKDAVEKQSKRGLSSESKNQPEKKENIDNNPNQPSEASENKPEIKPEEKPEEVKQ